MSSHPDPLPSRSEKPRVLFVDDEPLVLEGLKRSVYREFDTEFATSPEEGLAKVQKSALYPVIVSDMRMPGMDGAEFLSRVRVLSPDSVRVMLTGYADMEAATRAVNEGRIFRFLNKPVPPEQLTETLRACVLQYQIIRNEKELLEKTLAAAIRVLSEVLNLANPAAFNRGFQLRQYVAHIVSKIGLADSWQYEIAALLSELGCITFTPDIVDAVRAGQDLDAEDQERYKNRARIGHDLLKRIPKLEPVAEMILRQDEPGGGFFQPGKPPSEEAARNGSQLLKVALALDRLLSSGSTKQEALKILAQSPQEFDSRFVAALADFQASRQATELRVVEIRDLRVGMVLNEDLRSAHGLLLAAKGQEITYALVKTIRNFAEKKSITGRVRVTVGNLDPAMAKAAAPKL